MKARLVRNKAKGQSIPLIALMIVVLVALVGLAVDVGNTYAEQRNTQRASNAAALAGMNKLIGGGDDKTVSNEIKSSLKSNNIIIATGPQPQPGERILKAFYLDASGDPLAGCQLVGSGCSATALQGARYIKVTVTGKVDTYFARVVGRNDLPVGANAWAARGACADGIYPIGVFDQMLGANGFLNPDGTYSDSNYRNKTVKQFEIHDPATNPSGGFDWLRWAADTGDKERGTTAGATAAMMAGPGNISGGFDEAPWPDTNGLNIPKPNGYPILPGQLNGGDWMFPNTGVSNSNDINAALDAHISNKDVLILPIWDVVTGQGSTARYHVSRLGAFILLDYKLGGQGFLKLAYIGDAPECATITVPPKRTTDVSVSGPVSYRPRWKDKPSAAVAVQYEIILDVSGSMSWNYEGYGLKGGKTTLCTGANASCDGSHNFWNPKEERRIYFAKNAIKAFINQMSPNDAMRIVTFSGGPDSPYTNQNALDQLTDAYPTDTSVNKGWSSDKTVLNDAVDDAGSYNNNTYITEGRTPSAVGISRGAQEFSKAPSTNPAGITYKRVTIFMTDGVANIRLNGSLPDYPDGCGTEIPQCNAGTDDMPINAAGTQATVLKQYSQVYVIAMAGVPATGLDTIASQTTAPFFSTSQSGSDLTAIFNSINEDVRDGVCVPLGGTNFVSTMKESQIGSPDLVYPTVGYATLTDENGGTLPGGKGTAPIQMDADGKLSYRFDKLTPGIYQLSAYISYKGPDGVAHKYDQIYNTSTAENYLSQPLVVDAAEALGTVVPVDELHLDMLGGVCNSK